MTQSGLQNAAIRAGGARRPRLPAALALSAGLLLALWAGAAAAADVVLVLSSDAAPYKEAEAGLRERLSEHGRTSRTVALAWLSEKGRLEHAVDQGAAALVGIGTDAASWLHQQGGRKPPVAYCMVADPEGLGLDDAQGMVGVTTDVAPAEQFALIAKALPTARNIGLLYRSDQAKGKRLLQAAQAALPAGWKLETVAVEKHESAAQAIDALFDRKADVIWTVADTSVYNNASVRALLLGAVRRKVPVFGFSPAFVRAGALLGTGIDARTQGVQAADLVQERLAAPGAEHAAAPAHPKFEIAVNLVVAEQLGVTLPEALIERAAHVVRPGEAR